MSQRPAPRPSQTGPAATTVIAGIMVIAAGAVGALVGGLAALLRAVFAVRADGGVLGHATGILSLPLFLMLVVAAVVFGLLVIYMGVRILKRDNTARWTAIILIGLSALSSLGSSYRGLHTTYGNRFGSFVVGALVVVLLLLPSTARDFRQAREWRLGLRSAAPPPPYGAQPTPPPPPPMPPPPAPGASTPP